MATESKEEFEARKLQELSDRAVTTFTVKQLNGPGPMVELNIPGDVIRRMHDPHSLTEHDKTRMLLALTRIVQVLTGIPKSVSV